MLKNIYIKNFAIIDEVSIDFDKGYNVLTGETGSGKSIIVEALFLLAGGRIDKTLIGKREDYAIVEGYFSIDFSDEDFEKFNIEPTNELIITRRFTKNSSIVKINNRVTTLKNLESLSNKLIDVYGQNSQTLLLNKSNYLNILDSYGKKEEELESIKKYNKKLKDLKEEYSKFDLSQEEILREIDLLNYQKEEIENFNFNIDESELNVEYKRLNNAVEIINLSNEALEILNGDYNNVYDGLASALDNIRSISKYDEEVEDIYKSINSIYIELDYQINRLESYRDQLEVDPERLAEIDKIFSDLFQLKNKYGKDKESILEYLDKINDRLDLLSDYQNEKKKYRKKIEEVNDILIKLATDLSLKRKKKAKEFEKKIISQMKDLNIKNIDFEISFDKSDKISDDGFDDIDFLISTNVGEEKKSLSQVASGGEMSRFMLAFKSVIADIDKVSTLVFDEIDTGISGRTAQIVGEKLRDISKKHQILVITHLPQIAALADENFLIRKYVKDDSTYSNVLKLDDEGRIEEQARLIGGVNITDKTRSSAREMIKQAQNIKEK